MKIAQNVLFLLVVLLVMSFQLPAMEQGHIMQSSAASPKVPANIPSLKSSTLNYFKNLLLDDVRAGHGTVNAHAVTQVLYAMNNKQLMIEFNLFLLKNLPQAAKKLGAGQFRLQKIIDSPYKVNPPYPVSPYVNYREVAFNPVNNAQLMVTGDVGVSLIDISGHTEPIPLMFDGTFMNYGDHSCSYSPDGTSVACKAFKNHADRQENTMQFFNTTTGHLMHIIPLSRMTMDSDMIYDYRNNIVIKEDRALKEIDPLTRATVASVQLPYNVDYNLKIDKNHNGNTIWVTNQTNDFWLWNLNDPSILKKMPQPENHARISKVASSSDDTVIARSLIKDFQLGNNASFNNVSFNVDLFDIEHNRVIKKYPTNVRMDILYNPKYNQLAMSSFQDGTIYLIDPDHDNVVSQEQKLNSPLVAEMGMHLPIAYSADGTLLAVADSRKAIEIYELVTLEEIAQVTLEQFENEEGITAEDIVAAALES